MNTLHLTIRPRTAFGGAIRGDTLFGQLCWAIRHRHGEPRLEALLEGYAESPFAVCSDAFPRGFLPRPALPPHRFERVDEERKRIKKRKWLPLEAVSLPVRQWLSQCKTDSEAAAVAGDTEYLNEWHAQPHNRIHRQLGTTHGSEFAPYTQQQIWFGPGIRLDLWIIHDPERIHQDELTDCLNDIGLTGYGRDASIGLGKFDIEAATDEPLPHAPDADTCYTLAPCAPQGLALDAGRSFYAPFTRFGRHGDRAVLGGKPFKNPVLLADTGALLTPEHLPDAPLIGRGLGGAGELSKTIPATVQQGFAPCLFVNLEDAA